MRIVSKPSNGTVIMNDDGSVNEQLQQFFDDIEQRLNSFLLGAQVQLPEYSVLTLPSVDTKGGMIYVNDESGGAVPAFSDGTNWRRVTDRAIVS